MAAIGATLIFGFQNCTEEKDNTSSKALTHSMQAGSGGNGDPYTGKLSYLAFLPGHSCVDKTGKSVPSAISSLEKDGDHYRLVSENCVNKELPVLSSEVTAIANGALLYNQRIYNFYETAPVLASPEFHFLEAQCLETIESIHMRIGVPAPPVPGQTTTYDRHKVILMANWYADRSARVYHEEITETLTLPEAPHVRDLIKLLWLHDFKGLVRSYVNVGNLVDNEWVAEDFKLSVSPVTFNNLPTIHYRGDIQFLKNGTSTSVGVQCALQSTPSN